MSQAAARTDFRAVPRSERTRAAILAAAEALFAERGVAETRLEDVAAAVGIRRASIVYYFAGKSQLSRNVRLGLVVGAPLLLIALTVVLVVLAGVIQ